MNNSSWDKQTMLGDLVTIKRSLIELSESDLDDEAKLKLADQIQAVSTAIITLEAATLASFNREFNAIAPELQKAVSTVKRDLGKAKGAIATINAVAAGIGVVAKGIRILG